MVKIAASSDNHLDVNRQDIDEVLAYQAQVLNAGGFDYYLIVGDLFNDFCKTIDFVERLQSQLDDTIVYFVAGNHDMGRQVTETELENLVHPNYLHNQFVDIPGTDWRLIGLNGWYDYGFAPELPVEEAEKFHHGRFFDRMIDQSDTDFERYQRSYEQLSAQLAKGQAARKQMLVMTHFVPIGDDLLPNIAQPRELVNAMMGSPRTGELLEQTPDVRHVLFGHAHIKAPVRQHGQVLYDNVSVGVGRRNDWLAPTFLPSWEKRLKKITI